MPNSDHPIKVLVIDDSALMRDIIKTGLAADEGIEVVGAAPDPLVARQLIKQLNPDVITLDIEMPGMHGLDFLEKVMTLRPMPVVMVSTLTRAGAEATIEALEIGAMDWVMKPGSSDGRDLLPGGHVVATFQAEIVEKVKNAARSRVRPRPHAAARPPQPALSGAKWLAGNGKLIAVGASMGGVEAVREILIALPAESPPILVTQHMPETFTATFAARLNRDSRLTVVEAQDNMPIRPGHVYLAPGGRHLNIVRSAPGFACHVFRGEPVSGHRPSVDSMFASFAKAVGGRAKGVILTGMGRDGAQGLKAMRDAGAETAGQNEASCVVYGMPKAARLLGAVERELPLDRIAGWILAE